MKGYANSYYKKAKGGAKSAAAAKIKKYIKD
jgi:hypothetical protein